MPDESSASELKALRAQDECPPEVWRGVFELHLGGELSKWCSTLTSVIVTDRVRLKGSRESALRARGRPLAHPRSALRLVCLRWREHLDSSVTRVEVVREHSSALACLWRSPGRFPLLHHLVLAVSQDHQDLPCPRECRFPYLPFAPELRRLMLQRETVQSPDTSMLGRTVSLDIALDWSRPQDCLGPGSAVGGLSASQSTILEQLAELGLMPQRESQIEPVLAAMSAILEAQDTDTLREDTEEEGGGEGAPAGEADADDNQALSHALRARLFPPPPQQQQGGVVSRLDDGLVLDGSSLETGHSSCLAESSAAQLPCWGLTCLPQPFGSCSCGSSRFVEVSLDGCSGLDDSMLRKVCPCVPCLRVSACPCVHLTLHPRGPLSVFTCVRVHLLELIMYNVRPWRYPLLPNIFPSIAICCPLLPSAL